MHYKDPKPWKDVTGMTAGGYSNSREERYKRQNYVGISHFICAESNKPRTNNRLILKNTSKEMCEPFKLHFPCMMFCKSV